MRGKIKGLTKVEKEVLHLYTDEFLTIKQIQIRRQCSFQAVYKIIKNIKKKMPHFEKHREREKEKGQPYLEKINGETFFQIYESEKCFCYFCKYYSDKIIQPHHIIPKEEGGEDDPINILYVCPNCHRLLHTNYVIFFNRGYYFAVNNKDRKWLLPNISQKGLLRLPVRKYLINKDLPILFNSFGKVCNEKDIQTIENR